MLLASVILAAALLPNPKLQLSRRSALAIGGCGVVSAFAPKASAGLFGPYPGEQPTDLGVRPDGSLKACPPSPNCFSSSGDEKHYVSPFSYSKSDAAAQADLIDVLAAYPQSGVEQESGVIDGGGNAVVTKADGYVYAQFTSKKFGFKDDVEFAFSGGRVAIRSASRQGDSDLGVNAARLKYIAKLLAEKGGWKTELGI